MTKSQKKTLRTLHNYFTELWSRNSSIICCHLYYAACMLEAATSVCWLMRADVDRELCLVWQGHILAAIPQMKPCECGSFCKHFPNSYKLLQPYLTAALSEQHCQHLQCNRTFWEREDKYTFRNLKRCLNSYNNDISIFSSYHQCP